MALIDIGGTKIGNDMKEGMEAIGMDGAGSWGDLQSQENPEQPGQLDNEWLKKVDKNLEAQMKIIETQNKFHASEAEKDRKWREQMFKEASREPFKIMDEMGINRYLAMSHGITPAQIPTGDTAQSGTPSFNPTIYQEETAKGMNNVAMMLMALGTFLKIFSKVPK